MFEEAARKHSQWICSVGGGSPAVQGMLHGMGCVLDDYHVLTATHCWSEISNKYDWPVVARHDGLFRCEVVFKATEADILVLRSVEKIVDCRLYNFNEYPLLTTTPAFLGSLVGFMSRLKLDDSSPTFFAMGVISMFLPYKDSEWKNFAISNTIMQHGFSGSPVFRPDGSIVGVLTQTINFITNKTNPDEPWDSLPIVAPIWPLIHDINAVLIIS
jgi:hypothetical protein